MRMTVKDIAVLLGGELIGNGDAVITGVASVEDALAADAAFIASATRAKLLDATKAGAVLVPPDMKADFAGKNIITVKNPQAAFITLVEIFRPAVAPPEGIHPSASIDDGALVGRGVTIRQFAVVEAGACVGDGAVLYPGVYVGVKACVGAKTVLHSGVAVREGCVIGERVVIHCNSVVGSDGFGYVFDGTTNKKVPQRGNVVIGDDSEIGACVTIDRASLGSTVIGRRVKIDNLVQIAHNVVVGDDTIIVAQVGVSGSTKIGKRVVIAGQTGLAGHIEIGDGLIIGARSGVTGSLHGKGAYTGYPPVAHGEWLRQQGAIQKLPEMRKRVIELERRIEELEKKGRG